MKKRGIFTRLKEGLNVFNKKKKKKKKKTRGTFYSKKRGIAFQLNRSILESEIPRGRRTKFPKVARMVRNVVRETIRLFFSPPMRGSLQAASTLPPSPPSTAHTRGCLLISPDGRLLSLHDVMESFRCVSRIARRFSIPDSPLTRSPYFFLLLLFFLLPLLLLLRVGRQQKRSRRRNER